MSLIQWMAAAAHRKDGYLNLYFHPWEFTDLNQPEKYGFPGYVSKNSGETLLSKKNYRLYCLRRKARAIGLHVRMTLQKG